MDTTETIKVNFVADAKGLKTAIAQVDKELAKLVVRTDQAQRVLGNGLGKASTQAVAGLKNTTVAVRRASGAMNQYSAAQNAAMKRGGQMRANIQNLGYQFQDIAVQAEMGTNAMRILGQQGSQILGIFGPAGAIAGAGLAIGAALISPLITAAEKAKGLKEELEEIIEGFEFGGDKVSAEIAAATAAMIEADRQLTRIRRGIAERTAGREGSDYEAQLERLLKKTEEQRVEQEGIRNEALKTLLLLRAEADVREALVGDQAQEAANIREHNDYLREQQEIYDDLVDSIREQAINYQPLTQAQRELLESTQEVVDEYLKGQKSADGLKKSIGEAAYEALRLAGVDMFTPINAAQREAALLAANLGVAYRRAQEIQLSRVTAGGPDAARTTAARLTDNSEFGVPGGSLPDSLKPDKPKKGGGGKSAAEKAQDDLEKSIRKTMKAMDEQIKLTQQWSDQWEESLGSGIGSALDGFVDGLVSGELAFKDFAKSIIADLGKIALKAMIAQIILSSIGLTPGMSAADASFLQRVVGGGLGFDFAAKGMALNKGAPIPFANGGVVNAPTMFPMTGGRTGLMGEAGPEAIMPLQRDASGSLGVAGVAPKIVVNNYSGQEVVVNQNQEIIEIAVGHSRKAVANDFSQSMASGQGTYARAMESSYNSRRKAT